MGGEEGAEVAARDLGRWPPEWLRVDPATRVGADDLFTQEPWNGSREQEPAKDGAEWLRLDRGTRARCDHLRCSVRLLRCDPSLLKREGGRVSSCLHVGEPFDPAAQIGGDEIVARLRAAHDGWPAKLWQRHHAVGADPPSGSAPQLRAFDRSR